MEKHKHTIDPCALVTVELSRWGTHLLTLDNTEEMDEFEARQQLDEPERGLGFIPHRKPSVVRMQLWEAMRIFGPHITSSFRLPFMSIEAELPASEQAVQDLAKAKEYRAEVMKAEAVADRYRDLLNKIAPLIDIGHLDYCAPEDIERRVHDHLNFDVARQPNRPGPWWYGHKVLETVWVDQVDDEGLESQRLAVRLRNGHKKWVSELTQESDEWGGPARRDPRVELAQIKAQIEADKDIPF